MKWSKNITIAVLLSLSLILAACSDNQNADASTEEVPSGLQRLASDKSSSEHSISELDTFSKKEEAEHEYISTIQQGFQDNYDRINDDDANERYREALLEYSLILHDAETQLKELKQNDIVKKARTFIKKQTELNIEIDNYLVSKDKMGLLSLLENDLAETNKVREEYLEALEKYRDN